MKSNKGKYIAIAGLAITAIGTIGMDMMEGSSISKNNEKSASNGVITQKVIKETVVTEAPQEISIKPIPIMTEEDNTYIQKLRQIEELKEHREKIQIKADIAQAKALEATSLSSFATASEVKSITGGGKPAAISKASNINVGVNESSHVKVKSQPSGKQYEIKKAFEGIEVASISTNESGTDVWISQNGAQHHVYPGYVFNGLSVVAVTENKVVISHTKTNSVKTFQLTSLIMQEKEEVPGLGEEAKAITLKGKSSIKNVKNFLQSQSKG